MELVNILTQKYSQDQLAHFYIVEPNLQNIEIDFLADWSQELIKNMFNCSSIVNHSDFLMIGPNKEKSNYTLDDFKEFFSFLSYSATKEMRKIIIIDQAHRLSTQVSNKLLKTLEEPPVKSTIFLLNPNKSSLLPTINSRGIKIRVPVTKDLSLNDKTLNELEKDSLHKLIDQLKNNKPEHEKLLNQLIYKCNQQALNYKQLQELQNILKEYEQDRLYHNAPTHHLYSLARFISALADN